MVMHMPINQALWDYRQKDHWDLLAINQFQIQLETCI